MQHAYRQKPKKTRFPRLSLRWQLVAVFSDASFLITVLAGFILTAREKSMLSERIGESNASIYRALSAPTMEALRTGRIVDLQSIVTRIGQSNSDVARITVDSKDDTGLARWRRTQESREAATRPFTQSLFLGDEIIGRISIVTAR